MYNKLLLPIAEDCGEHTDSVLEIARALAAEDAEIVLIHVVEAIPQYALTHIPEELLERNREETQQMLGTVAKRLGRTCKIVSLGGHVGRTLLDYAETHGTDCIVMRSHRPEMQDVIFGSTAAHVVRHATCSVHVVR